MELNKDIKCVIFDFDGTIFHLDISWNKLKKDLKLDKIDSPGIGQHIQKLNQSNHADLDIVTQAELLAVGHKKLERNVTNTFKTLVSKGLKLAILTRNSRFAVEKVFANSRLSMDIFIIGREDAKNLKPDPEGLKLVLDHFKLTSRQAVLIGDTFHDVEAAKAIELKSVIVSNPKLEYRPTGADCYIHRIEDLLMI